MTIAACYLTHEGVVFGADSTTTIYVPSPGQQEGRDHHFNFGQKIYQVGENSTLAIATWGLGNLGDRSYRTLVAELADQLAETPPTSVYEVAWRWSSWFWSEYSRYFANQLQIAQSIIAKGDAASEEEKKQLDNLRFDASCGFCIGGNVQGARSPDAYEILFSVDLITPPVPRKLTVGNAQFWGWPNLINRLVWGVDSGIYSAILNSGKWSGTQDELIEVLLSKSFVQPRQLPLREAIDWVFASIYTTIKAMKFSHFAPYCGGPIEVAVVSSDRQFRWVTHKAFDAAIRESLV